MGKASIKVAPTPDLVREGHDSGARPHPSKKQEGQSPRTGNVARPRAQTPACRQAAHNAKLIGALKAHTCGIGKVVRSPAIADS